MKSADPTIPEPGWKNLYRISGIATLIMMVFFLFDTAIFFILGPYPDSGQGWFDLLRDNRTAGLLLLSIPTLFGAMLYYLTFLCLFNILRKDHAGFAALAALAAFVGLTILIMIHPAYSIVQLSNQYAAAAEETRRAALVSAAQMKMAEAGVGLNIGGFLSEGAAVIFSILMLHGKLFGKTTAWLGIAGHGLDFFRTVLNLVFVTENISAVLLMVGGLPQLIWLILVGLKLIQLGRMAKKTEPST
ncbi:hypothetical protein JW906_10390 [bacterium]|nr:hypothetical protein [bacterium]